MKSSGVGVEIMSSESTEYKPTEEEKRSKEWQRDSNRRKMNAAETKINNLNEKKKRLEEAKKVLEEENSSFKDMIRQINNYDMKIVQRWSGNQHKREYEGTARSFVDYYSNTRNQAVNRALDELNWAIQDIQEDLNAQWGIFGEAKSLFEKAVTWLENWFN